MQAFASLHVVPFAFGVAEQTPFAGLHVPVLQAFVRLLQSTGVPLLHVSEVRSQVSTPLQALPSSQFALVVHPQAPVLCTQPPATSLQLSTVQAMPSSHGNAGPPHVPDVQTSLIVQTFASLHVVPLAFAGLEQTPFAGLQVPALWH